MDDLPVNHLLHGDSLDLLPMLPAASIDCIFADPPYNLQLRGELWRPNLTRVDAVDDAWDQFDDFAAYDAFTRTWLSAARRVLKPTGTIWVSGTYHNIFRIGALLQDLGFWLLNTITWYKPNAMPNFRGRRLKNDVEFIIWAKHSEKSRYTFNHHAMKRFNGGKQLGSLWTIPVCGGSERLRDVDGKKLHSTQKPEALLERILIASTRPGDVVLDPFIGTGTSAVVAQRLGRRWIGIEREAAYVQAARDRLMHVDTPPDFEPPHDPPSLTRVPFKALVRGGWLQPGQMLYLDDPAVTAEILVDGRLHAVGQVGSIHQLGARLKSVPSCNGWLHWRYIDPDDGTLRPLEALRARFRTAAASDEHV